MVYCEPPTRHYGTYAVPGSENRLAIATSSTSWLYRFQSMVKHKGLNNTRRRLWIVMLRRSSQPFRDQQPCFGSPLMIITLGSSRMLADHVGSTWIHHQKLPRSFVVLYTFDESTNLQIQFQDVSAPLAIAISHPYKTQRPPAEARNRPARHATGQPGSPRDPPCPGSMVPPLHWASRTWLGDVWSNSCAPNLFMLSSPCWPILPNLRVSLAASSSQPPSAFRILYRSVQSIEIVKIIPVYICFYVRICVATFCNPTPRTATPGLAFCLWKDMVQSVK